MKHLTQIINEMKSPRGCRGYIALVETSDGREIFRLPYAETPEAAVEKHNSYPGKKKIKVVEGPYLLTLKGYNWYCNDYLHFNMYYNDNGYQSNNYDLEQIPVDEAWKTITDPKNRFIKK